MPETSSTRWPHFTTNKPLAGRQALRSKVSVRVLLDFCVLQNGNRRCIVKEIRRTGQDHANSVLHVVNVVGADAGQDCARSHRPGETNQHCTDDLSTVRGPAKLGHYLWLWPWGTCELDAVRNQKPYKATTHNCLSLYACRCVMRVPPTRMSFTPPSIIIPCPATTHTHSRTLHLLLTLIVVLNNTRSMPLRYCQD